MKEYQESKKRINVSSGESVRIIRELQGVSRDRLSVLTGISRSTISDIEHDKVDLGVEKAKILAKALKCDLAVLFFGGLNIKQERPA